MKKNYLKSLSIKERIEFNITNFSDENYKTWKSTKSLLSTEDKEKMITILYESFEQFSIGIGTFKKKIDSKFINTLDWFQKFDNYIDNLDDYEKFPNFDMGYAFRFILLEVKKNINTLIEENKYFTFDESIINDFIDSFYNQMIEIINKTIINDLHEFKKISALKGDTGEERFSNYLKIRFGNKQAIKEFYREYPNLIRLMVKRKEYFIYNSNLLISRMNNNLQKFLKELGITNFHVEKIRTNLGDTHDNGNSVTIIELINRKKIIYKPKNLEIAKKIDEFMYFCNTTFNCDFYIPHKLVRKEYCFEEFVEHMPLQSLKDAEAYYFNFGCMLALVHMLNGNDMHHENIIAQGKHPTLIDAETFIQQNVPVNLGEIDATYKCKEKFLDSVLSTAMLPLETLKDRSDNKNKGIEISALKSGKEKIPFKILKIINANTDSMRYSYENAYTVNENNVPLYQEEEISYKNYKSNIYIGFSYLMKKFLENKSIVTDYIKYLFSDLYVRHVIRPTQRYKDLLEYSYHPDCMKDAYYQEVILQNLWSYPYTNKEFCMYEQEEMKNCDIPQFFLHTNKRSLFTNEKIEIKNIFSQTPLELVLEKFNQLNENTIKEQILFIKSSFKDIYPKNYPVLQHHNTQEFNIGTTKNLIDHIVLKVTNSLVVDHNSQTVSMIDIKFTNNSWDISVSNDNLYDGLSGIYLLLTAYESLTKKSDFASLKDYIINTVNKSKIKNINPFFGIGSLIYPLLVEYELTNNKQKLKLAKELTHQLIDQNISKNADWINGSISFIPILLYLYDVTKDMNYYKKAVEIEEAVNPEDYHYNNSFAHGIEGLNYIQNLLDVSYSPKLSNKNVSEMNGWCKGDVGVSLAYALMKKTKSFHIPDVQNNNTLCHGNMGLIELIIQKKKTNDINIFDAQLLNKIINGLTENHKKNNLLGVQEGFSEDSLSLFVGISGIAYELIRLLDNRIPNVLVLEIKSKE